MIERRKFDAFKTPGEISYLRARQLKTNWFVLKKKNKRAHRSSLFFMEIFSLGEERAATKRPQNEAPLLFTHPIFESDFDCLTGKNRLHAISLLSLSPLTNKKKTQRRKQMSNRIDSCMKDTWHIPMIIRILFYV